MDRSVFRALALATVVAAAGMTGSVVLSGAGASTPSITEGTNGSGMTTEATAVTATRSAPAEIAPGDTGTVTVSVDIGNRTTKLNVEEEFSPAFASTSATRIEINGNSASPSVSLFTEENATVTFARPTDPFQAGDTVTIEYRVEVPTSASGGSTFDISGSVNTSAGTASTGTDTITVPKTGQGNFQVGSLSAPGNASRNESITITADVTNTGTKQGIQIVEWRLDNDTNGVIESDEVLATETLTLNASESGTVSFSYTVPGDFPLGEVDHGVFSENDSATGTLNVTRDTGGGQAGAVNATRSLQTSVGPGESTTVTLEIDMLADADRLSVTELFSPPVASTSARSIQINGQSTIPTSATFANDTGLVVLQNLKQGDTITITYELSLPANASIGATFEVSGTVSTPTGDVAIGNDTVTVESGLGRYGGSDNRIATSELRTAIGDWVSGTIDTSLLLDVIDAWVKQTPV